MKKVLIVVGILLILGGAVIFFGTIGAIGWGVRADCELAQDKYAGDCVEALIQVVNSEDENYRTRNSAIWALGQIGDERSLSVLKSFFTGVHEDKHGTLEDEISQYELDKAIKLIEGGTNLGKPFWWWIVEDKIETPEK